MGDSRPTCDLEAYASRYEGRSRVLRLRFIACRSIALERDAWRLALDAAKRGRDTILYQDLVNMVNERLGFQYELDKVWIAQTDKAASVELDRLRRDLEDHRQQHNTEVIRAGHNDLGDHFYARGKIESARGEYITMRDYCTHTNHHIDMCMKVILVSIDAREFYQVENYVHIAENTADIQNFPLHVSKFRCCAGLALLVRGRYKEAATRLLSIRIDMSEENAKAVQALFNDIFTLEDVATYAGLSALATLDRDELMEKIIGNVEFRALIELVPDIRELITDFCATRYSSCLAYLDRLRPDLLLDPYLGCDGHVDRLYRKIRSKALVQYVDPYVTVDLARMAAVFKTEIENLEEELVELIENNTIQFRIDTQNRSLHRKTKNVRRSAVAEALAVGQTAFDEAEAMLLRMNLIKHDLSTSSHLPQPVAATESLGAGLAGGNPSNTLFDVHARVPGVSTDR
jgi:COP9 signalosome complex subunit 1